jgi:hypothetical protein
MKLSNERFIPISDFGNAEKIYTFKRVENEKVLLEDTTGYNIEISLEVFYTEFQRLSKNKVNLKVGESYIYKKNNCHYEAEVLLIPIKEEKIGVRFINIDGEMEYKFVKRENLSKKRGKNDLIRDDSFMSTEGKFYKVLSNEYDNEKGFIYVCKNYQTQKLELVPIIDFQLYLYEYDLQRILNPDN